MLGRLLAGARRHAVGLVALAIAVGGSAYAATTTRAPANPRIYACVAKSGGAVRLVGPRARCLRTERKRSWSQLGPRGLRGLRGLAGAPGQPGAPGAGGATNVTVRQSTETVPSSCNVANQSYVCSGSGTQTASCAPGERAVGGGFDRVSGVTASRPNPTAGTPTGWTVTFGSSSFVSGTNETSHSFPVYAVCAAP
jgi:hypothetical protein